MDRRHFLKSSALLAAAPAIPGFSHAQSTAAAAPWSDGKTWNSYEITTRVELKPDGDMRVWIPMPLSLDTDWYKGLNSAWTGNATTMRVLHDPKYNSSLFYAEWSKPVDSPYVALTSNFSTRDRSVDLSKPRSFEPTDALTLERYLEATQLMPINGLVRTTAKQATRSARTDVEKVRALYEWIVQNTHRDPKTRGCGLGDVRAMFESNNFGGKCGDLNAAFVALCRSVGIPARDVYGIRVDSSKWGYRSLGTASAATSATITGAQHCRAEVYLKTHGWVPMDPADVRKVMLEEPPGNLPLGNEKVELVHAKLFGAWEMNWMPMNYAHDVKLPNGKGAPIPFMMYPNAETAAGRKDSLDPASFKYVITSRKLA